MQGASSFVGLFPLCRGEQRIITKIITMKVAFASDGESIFLSLLCSLFLLLAPLSSFNPSYFCNFNYHVLPRNSGLLGFSTGAYIYMYIYMYVSGVTATPSPNCKLRITPVKVHRQVAIFELFTVEPRVYSIHRRRSM